MNAILLQAQNAQGGGMQMIIMMVVLFAIVYFFMIRPQNKQRKKIDEFRKSLTVGQDIVTIGGIHGTIKSINEEENTLSIEVATGVKITVSREAISLNAEQKK